MRSLLFVTFVLSGCQFAVPALDPNKLPGPAPVAEPRPDAGPSTPEIGPVDAGASPEPGDASPAPEATDMDDHGGGGNGKSLDAAK
jgi:hypothetical protein